MCRWCLVLGGVLCLLPAGALRAAEPKDVRHLLYVAVPGVRNYLEFGGAGILVFDRDAGHKFVRRIVTPASQQAKPENIKGICACAATGKLYFTTLTRLYCLDLRTDQPLWEKALPGGCDRLAITPDGKWLVVPALEGAHWNLVDAATGEVVQQIHTGSGSHNTICSLDGREAYLAGLRSPYLEVFDLQQRRIVRRVGPFQAAIRPFTVDGRGQRCYVTVNGLLGYEVGDLKTGHVLAHVEVRGVPHGKPKRHGCPSHGIALTPDEREVWVCDAANQALHVFDNTRQPPVQLATIRLREEPGWITFSRDGRFAYPSTGDVIDTQSRKIVTSLFDEKGRPVLSEKVLEILFRQGAPFACGDQFGLGRRGS
jgi:DNA-binding beta-propeller fold protein YncE